MPNITGERIRLARDLSSMMIVFVEILPDLRRLDLGGMSTMAETFNKFVEHLVINGNGDVQTSIRWPPGLQSLESLANAEREYGGWFNFSEMVPYLFAPKLTTLHVTKAVFGDQAHKMSKGRHMCALKYIYLDYSSLNISEILDIIDSCKALVRFVLTQTRNDLDDQGFELDGAYRIVDSLRAHKESLEDLQIVDDLYGTYDFDYDAPDEPDDVSDEPDQSPINLTEFTKLSTLHIDLCTLLGTNLRRPLVPLLPPNLVDLRLSTGRAWMVEDKLEELWERFDNELTGAKDEAFLDLIEISLDADVVPLWSFDS